MTEEEICLDPDLMAMWNRPLTPDGIKCRREGCLHPVGRHVLYEDGCWGPCNIEAGCDCAAPVFEDDR